MDDLEKSRLGTMTFVGFCQQFGDDVHAQILLEELLKGIMNEETLFVFGEPLEAGDQIGNSSPERICDNFETDGFVESGPTDSMAKEDLPNYP